MAAYSFQFPQLFWIHKWQKRDMDYYVRMITKTKSYLAEQQLNQMPLQARAQAQLKSPPMNSAPQPSQQLIRVSVSGESVSIDPMSLHFLTRGWYFLQDIMLKGHVQVEDDLFFPEIRKFAKEAAEEPLKKLDDDHKIMEEKKKRISDIILKLSTSTKPMQHLTDLENAFLEFATMYKEHMEYEEKVCFKFVTECMPDAGQKALVKRIEDLSKSSPGGKLHVVMFKVIVRDDPEQNAIYRATIPAFVRNVLTPIFSYLDPCCKEYFSIFHRQL